MCDGFCLGARVPAAHHCVDAFSEGPEEPNQETRAPQSLNKAVGAWVSGGQQGRTTVSQGLAELQQLPGLKWFLSLGSKRMSC